MQANTAILKKNTRATNKGKCYTQTDKEIGAMAYALYDLTEEEIKIVKA